MEKTYSPEDLDDILQKDTWTAEDHMDILNQLFGVKDAVDKFRQLLAELEEKNPDPTGSAALKIGMLRYSLCRFNEAVEVLKSATDNKYRYYYSGLCNSALRRFDQALEDFRRAKQRGMDDPEIEVCIVESTLLDGDIEGATKSLKDAKKKLSGTADGLYLEGMLAEIQGEEATALQAYDSAREIQPGHIRSTFRLAYFLDLHGEEDEALELYTESLEHPPLYASVLMNMAVLYEDMGEYDKAVSCLKKILHCNPNHRRAKLFLRDAVASKDMYYDEDKARRIAKRNAVLDISVSDFELSVRARNCLKKMNIHTLGDLVRTTEAELLTYKNFGETSLKEIKDMLAAKSLTLGQALEEDSDLTGFASAASGEDEGSKQEVGIRAISIDKLDLSIRAQRVLENLNIRTLGQLADRTEAELTCQKNFGKTSLQEVKDALSQYGLALRTVK